MKNIAGFIPEQNEQLEQGKIRYLRFTYPSNKIADDLMCVEGCSLTKDELKPHVSEALRQAAKQEHSDDYETVDAAALILTEKLKCKFTVIYDENEFEVTTGNVIND